MMDKDRLRKADIFSGIAFSVLGIYIIFQAVKMPMKGSWGGVHNVWYVSPALFPLLVGAMITLTGGLLARTAIKEVGFEAVKQVGRYLLSPAFSTFLKQESTIRFYAVITVLISFVFGFVPRVDFFLSAIAFLLVFILLFFLEDARILMKLFKFYACQILIFFVLILTPLHTLLSGVVPYPADILMLGFIFSFALYAHRLCRKNDLLKKKYMTGLIVAVIAPIFIGICFKYLLLVPMPFEGMGIAVLDYIWYL
jgi:hypothetical protein